MSPDLPSRTAAFDPAAGRSIYQHPLAYLIGLEGVALLKAFAGEYDRGFTEARLAEVRALLDTGDVLGRGVEVPPMSTSTGYDGWAPSYDNPENGIFAIEETWLHPLLDSLPVGDVVDAACGTGRHTAYLLERGHRVQGFDISPGMLELARAKDLDATFELADVRQLPVTDASADAVVCALALSHVEHLGPVFAEVARVLRPGGRFLISDTRGHFIGSSLYPVLSEDPEENVGYLPNWRHSTVEYLQAALAHGFVVRHVEEPLRPEPIVDDDEAPEPVEDPDLPPDVWALHAHAAEAANAAKRDDPALIVWDFELAQPLPR